MKIFKKESFGLKRKGELVFHSCAIYKKIKEILYNIFRILIIHATLHG